MNAYRFAAILAAVGVAGVGLGHQPAQAKRTASITSLRLATGDSSWTLDGQPDDAARPLRSVPGHNAFWFAWSAFHPGTEVWGEPPMRNEPPTFEPDDRSTVPRSEVAIGCSGRDCIPPLDSPYMTGISGPGADYLADDDMVFGVLTATGPRAYPHNILWWHEIINEQVGDDAYAVTFCPLTGSGLEFDRTGFAPGKTTRLGVSGLLYNANLVMWDRETGSLWSQMRLEAIAGPRMKARSPLRGTFEMTWKAWRRLHPDTLVVSKNTGYRRDYRRYPYGDYRNAHDNTFRPTNPAPDPSFQNKERVFGVIVAGHTKAYVWRRVFEERGESGVIEDEVGGQPILVVFDRASRYFHAFERSVGGKTRSFTLRGRRP